MPHPTEAFVAMLPIEVRSLLGCSPGPYISDSDRLYSCLNMFKKRRANAMPSIHGFYKKVSQEEPVVICAIPSGGGVIHVAIAERYDAASGVVETMFTNAVTAVALENEIELAQQLTEIHGCRCVLLTCVKGDFNGVSVLNISKQQGPESCRHKMRH